MFVNLEKDHWTERQIVFINGQFPIWELNEKERKVLWPIDNWIAIKIDENKFITKNYIYNCSLAIKWHSICDRSFEEKKWRHARNKNNSITYACQRTKHTRINGTHSIAVYLFIFIFFFHFQSRFLPIWIVYSVWVCVCVRVFGQFCL